MHYAFRGAGAEQPITSCMGRSSSKSLSLIWQPAHGGMGDLGLCVKFIVKFTIPLAEILDTMS